MADRYRTPDDWTVEVVQLAEEERMRFANHGYCIADVRSVPELERWIHRDRSGRRDRSAGTAGRR